MVIFFVTSSSLCDLDTMHFYCVVTLYLYLNLHHGISLPGAYRRAVTLHKIHVHITKNKIRSCIFLLRPLSSMHSI
jgi:hypothetical protein